MIDSCAATKYHEHTSMDNPSLGLPPAPVTPFPPALFPAPSLPSVPASALRGILSSGSVETGRRGGFQRVGFVRRTGGSVVRNTDAWSVSLNVSKIRHRASRKIVFTQQNIGKTLQVMIYFIHW